MIGAVAGASATPDFIQRGTNSGASGVKMEGFRFGDIRPSPSDTVRRLCVSELEISSDKFLIGEEMFSEIETVPTRP